MRGIVLIAALLLAGCEGTVIGAAIRGQAWRDQQDDAYCRRLGAKFGTPEYVQCRQIETARRDRANAAALNTMATGLAIAATPPPAPQPAPQPLDCTRTGRDTMRCQ